MLFLHGGLGVSWVADTIGLLDSLGVERAAIVGLSFGGGLAGGVSGMPAAVSRSPASTATPRCANYGVPRPMPSEHPTARSRCRDPTPHDRLQEISVPTLVVVPSHDPPEQKDVGSRASLSLRSR